MFFEHTIGKGLTVDRLRYASATAVRAIRD